MHIFNLYFNLTVTPVEQLRETLATSDSAVHKYKKQNQIRAAIRILGEQNLNIQGRSVSISPK